MTRCKRFTSTDWSRGTGYSSRCLKGAQILSVQAQGEVVCVWALVDTDFPDELRDFWLMPTGATFDGTASLEYRGTVLLHGGEYVLHVFEQLE